MSQPILSHHLPRPAQNAACLAVLAAAPLINLAISINCFDRFRTISKQQLPINQSLHQSLNGSMDQWIN